MIVAVGFGPRQSSDRPSHRIDVDGLVSGWLGLDLWVELVSASPLIGALLRVWDRGVFQYSPSRLMTCIMPSWFLMIVVLSEGWQGGIASSRRCSATQYKKPCLFFCNKCCQKCLCVPSGTYGHKEECPCYNTWKTKEGTPKCP
ncbi:hypothetical protein TIFTF001_032991 [Ficus carica]|uniref:Gibberellin regulated protein n=1 Tax=Ficus carica TaxID=3494 RepID=A0AA88J746_FICCA|nr:hypothetical protein TIFTF001_032991 [Ficus carica]